MLMKVDAPTTMSGAVSPSAREMAEVLSRRVLAAIAFYPITQWLMGDNGVYSVNAIYGSTLVGLALTAAL